MKDIYSLLEVFGDQNLIVTAIKEIQQIPLFYRDRYAFYEVKLFNQKYVLIHSKEQKINIKQFFVMSLFFEDEFEAKSLFNFEVLSPLQRKKMRESRISYIDKQGNFYLNPGHINESTFRSKTIKDLNKMNVVAQLTYMYFLYKIKNEVRLKDISNYFNVSEMHASRALNDLLKLELVECVISGKTNRAKTYQINPKIDFFKEGLKSLNSPIMKIVRCDALNQNMFKSSDFALDQYTNLSDVQEKRYAIDKKKLKSIQISEDGEYELEVWRYSPAWFSKDDFVDIFSLYLIYKDNHDIRVQNELKELVGKQGWLKD